MLTKSQDFGQVAASLWLRLTSLFQRSLESGEDVCSSNSFLGRSVCSSTWRQSEVLRGPDPSRETPSGRPLVPIPPFCLCGCLGNNSWGMGGSPDGQRGNRRSFMYSICLYVSCPPSSAPNPPRASSSHRQMPLNNTPPHTHTLLGALFSQLASCQARELLVLCHHVLQARWYLSTSADMLL